MEVNAATIVLVTLIGLISGGVVNALADDLPKRRSPRPPHYPDDAPRPISAWLGLTAFLTGQRSSPRGARLSWRHPLVEIGTAILMLLALLSASDEPEMTFVQFVFWLLYLALFALITVIDLEHRLILFVVIVPSLALALLDSLITAYPPNVGDALLGAAIGFGAFFLLYLGGFVFTALMSRARGQEIDEVAFGYGDVMLITLAGLILGWRALIVTMFLTVFLGALGALLYLLARRLMRRGYSVFTPLPYGQYIVIATTLMLLYGREVGMLLRGGA